MSILKVYHTDQPDKADIISDHDQITNHLQSVGIRFERWLANELLVETASQDEVLAAYQVQINQLMDEYGFRSADVIALTPDHPDRKMLRQKFLDEHSHSDFEVRFFVAGCGLFYMHVDDSVFAVMCEQGDLISVPAGMKHWFDMGAAPSFKCIRFFTTEEGWVANYSGDDIASTFPRFENFITP